MQFSSIPTLIDAHVYAQLHNTPLKGAALFLFVSSKSPLVLEDATKIQVTASEDDLQAYFHSYEKIEQGSRICLDNVQVLLDYGKGYSIQAIELNSKSVIADVGSKDTKLKNFDLKVTLEKHEGQFPLAITTYRYLRRMERQDLLKKNYKPNKIEITQFIKGAKSIVASEVESYISQEVISLDTESVQLLKRLLKFTDKEELFKVLLRKPLKDKHSKKAVRLSIIPTDVESEGEGF